MAAQRAWSADNPEPIPEPTADVSLTSQETEVLRLVARRFTNPAIAAELGISVPLVKHIRRGLRTKLGIDDTAGLVAWALHSGIAVDDPADAPDPELQARVTDALRRATPGSHEASPIPADLDGSGETQSAKPAEAASDPAQTALAEHLGLPPGAVTRGAVRLALALVAEQTHAMPTAVTGIDGQAMRRWIRSQLELHADQEAATHEGALAELERRDGEESGLRDAADPEADPLDQNGFDNRRRALDQELRALLGLRDLSPPQPLTTGEVLAELYWITSLTDSPELEHLVAASETFLCATLEPPAAVPLDTVQIHTLRNQLARQVGVADDELTRTHAEVLAAEETVAPQTRRLAERYLTLLPSRTEQKPNRADIARLAGVGDSYVSSVFNGRFGAKKPWHGETTQRVLAAAHQLGVPPDRADIAALTDPNFVTRRVRPARWIGNEFVPAHIKPQPPRDKLAEAAGTAKATVRDAVKGSGTPDDLRLVRSAADEIGFWYHPDGPMGAVDASTLSEGDRATTSGTRIDPVAIDLGDSDEPDTAVQRARQGDATAFNELRERYGRASLREVLARLGVPASPVGRDFRPLLQVAQELNRMAFGIAEAHRWRADAGTKPSEWLHSIVGGLVDGWFELNATQRKHVTEAVDAMRRGAAISLVQRGALNRLVDAGEQVITDAETHATDSSQQTDSGLTNRQFTVLELIAAGMTSPEIAEELGLSPGTVSIYATQVRQKLGARNRAEAVYIALSTGILPGSPRADGETPGREDLRLTSREIHVLARIANGDTSDDIAQDLEISPKSVDQLVGRVGRRLGARNRPGIVAAAVRIGDLPLADPADAVPGTGRIWLADYETNVVTRIANGETSKDIAQALGMSSLTVDEYLMRVCRKLRVHNRAAMIAVAIRTGLLPETPEPLWKFPNGLPPRSICSRGSRTAIRTPISRTTSRFRRARSTRRSPLFATNSAPATGRRRWQWLSAPAFCPARTRSKRLPPLPQTRRN